jgi:polysaccharide biosynthesis protein VpsM
MENFLSSNIRYGFMKSCFVFLLTAVISYNVAAQEAAAIYVGPFDVTPTLNMNVENDDNVFSQSGGDETSASLTRFMPSIAAVADDGVVRYSLAYQLENGRYSGVDNNDYTDHQLDAKMDWRLSIRHLIEFGATESRGHDERSTESVSVDVDNVADITAADLDKTKNRELSANYTFGSDGARGRLVIGFKTSSLRYTTNRQLTNVLESDTDTINASFSVGIGASSRATVEVVDTSNRFRTNTVNDRQDRRYLVGFEWGASDIVKASVSVGRSKSDLINATGDTSSSVGEASIIWSPVEYSVFTLSADKAAQNTENNIGSFVERSNVSLGWRHQFNDKLTAEISLDKQTDDFASVNRRDTSKNVQLQLNYAFRRWLSMGMGITRTERTSTDSSLDYDNNKVTVSVNASL